MAGKTAYSLKRRLLAWVSIPALTILAASAYYDFRTSYSSTTRAYDQALLSTAIAISPFVRPAAGDHEGRPELVMSEAVESTLRADRYDHIEFVVRDHPPGRAGVAAFGNRQ